MWFFINQAIWQPGVVERTETLVMMLAFMMVSFAIYQKKASYIPVVFGLVGLICSVMVVLLDNPVVIKGARNGLFLLCLAMLGFSQYLSSSD